MPLRRSTVYALDVVAYTRRASVDARPARQLAAPTCARSRTRSAGTAARSGAPRSGRSRVADAVTPEAFDAGAAARRGGRARRVGARGVIVARRPEELEPARRAVAIGTFDGVHRGHRRVIEAARAARLRVDGRDVRPASAHGASAGRSSCSSTLERRLELLEEPASRTCSSLRFDDELAALDAGGVRGDGPARDRRRGRRGRRRLPLRPRPQRRPRPARAARLRRAPRAARRQRVVEPHPGAARARATSRTRRSCSAGRRRSRGSSSSATSAGGCSASRPRTSRCRPSCSCPQLGIYAGAALGHRAAISIGTNPHYGGTERRVEASPARLRRRPLRAAARRRALGAAARRGAPSTPRRSSSRRSTHDVARTRAAVRPGLRLDAAQVFAPTGVFIAYGSRSRRARDRSRVLESVRCLECGEIYSKPIAGGTVREEPGLPDLRLRRLDPGQPAAGPRARAAPPRVGGCSGSPERADAAEVVVPLGPAAHRAPARLERARARPRRRRAPRSRRSPAGCTRGRVDGRLRLEALVEDPGGDGDERACAAACRPRRRSRARARRRRARASAPSCSASARPARAGRGAGRSRRACCSGAGRGPAASRRSRGRGSS